MYYAPDRYVTTKRKVSPGDAGVSIAFGEPPLLIAPAYEAAQPAAGALVWSSSGPVRVEVSCSGVHFEIRTAASSTLIPVLAGAEIAAGTTCTWRVRLSDDGRGPGARVDPSAAAPAALTEASGNADRSVTIQ